MALRDELEQQGNWLFRHRSYLPLVLLVPFLIVMSHYEYPNGSYALHVVMHLACMAVALAGLAVRFLVAGNVPDGTSGRNTRQQVATSLNTSGLYSVVRHPLYLGNFLLWIAIPLFCANGWLLAVFCLAFWLYYERIMVAEEAFLRQKFGEPFEQWASRTPAFFPRLSNWTPTDRTFCWRRAVRQEYTTLFLAVQAQVGLQVLESLAINGRLTLPREWVLLAALGLAAYLLLRFLKKHTQVLVVSG